MSQGFTITDETTSRTLLMASASTPQSVAPFRLGYVNIARFQAGCFTRPIRPRSSGFNRRANNRYYRSRYIADRQTRAPRGPLGLLDPLVPSGGTGFRRYIRASRPRHRIQYHSVEYERCRTEDRSLEFGRVQGVGRNSVQFEIWCNSTPITEILINGATSSISTLSVRKR